MFENFWFATFLLPLLAVLLKSEIANLYKSWTVFHRRSFDQDRDPDTPDSCQVYDDATGQWNDVLIVRYGFALDKNKRGVFVLHPVDGKLGKDKQWAAERISLLVWADMRKRKLPTSLEADLEVIVSQKIITTD